MDCYLCRICFMFVDMLPNAIIYYFCVFPILIWKCISSVLDHTIQEDLLTVSFKFLVHKGLQYKHTSSQLSSKLSKRFSQRIKSSFYVLLTVFSRTSWATDLVMFYFMNQLQDSYIHHLHWYYYSCRGEWIGHWYPWLVDLSHSYSVPVRDSKSPRGV